MALLLGTSLGAYPQYLGHTRYSRLESRLERVGKGFFGLPIPGEKKKVPLTAFAVIRYRLRDFEFRTF